MNPAETEEIASAQNSTTVQVADRVEISTVDTHTVTDLTTVPRIITTTSEASTSPQNHVSTTLENTTAALGETTSTAAHGDNVTFGSNHISIFKESSKPTSGDAVAPHWAFSTVSKDVILDTPRNVNSTASENISSKEYVPNISSSDNITSTVEETKTVLRNITTDDANFTAPRNMATDEDNTDSTITATPEVHLIPTIVLGDVCDAPTLKEMVPVPGDMRNVTSGEKPNNSVFGDAAVAATSLGSTPIFVDTNGNKASPSPGDYTTDQGGITVVPEDAINCARPISDPGEVFQTSFKETCPISSEAIAVLSGGITDNLSTVETSTISNTFSAMFQLPSTVVSGNMICLSDGNTTAAEGLYTASGSECRPIKGNKTDCESREVGYSPLATTTTSLGDLPNASTDDDWNASQNVTTTVSVETIQDVSRTDNGNTFAIIVGENATASGNITTTHLETVPVNEAIPVVPGNVTSVAGTRGATTANPENVTIAPGHIQTVAAVKMTTNPGNASTTLGETATILSCGDVIMTAVPLKEAIIDSENSTITMTPSSITAFADAKATRYITDTGSGDSTTREDTLAAAPESSNPMESPYGKDTKVISGETICTTLIKTFEETTTATVSFQESTSNFIPAGAKPTAPQGSTFSSMNENVTTCGSFVVPEGEFGVTSDNNTTIGDKATGVGFGHDTIASASGETVATSQDIMSPVPTYVTAIVSIQDSVGTSAKREFGEPPETITGKTTRAFRDAIMTPGDTAPSDVTDTIPTVIVTHFDSNPSSDAIVLVSGDAANISWFSREIKTNALEDATSTGTSDVAFINIANSGGISTDTPEEICYGERVTSGPSEATTTLGHASTADSSFSIGTSIQETNTSPEGTTTAFGYTPNIPEGPQPGETFACLPSEILASSADISNFSETNILGARISAETTTEKTPTGNAASSPGDSNIWCENPICLVTVGTQNINDTVPLNIPSTSAISLASETCRIPELTHASHTITTPGIYTTFATGDTANVTTSVDTDKAHATKSREATIPETASASGDFAKRTTLLGDATTITTTATGTTATAIAHENALMTTQAFSDDITTVSGDKSTTILENTPKPGENVISEKIAPAIPEDTTVHSEILLHTTRSSGETLILEDTCDPLVSKESLIPKQTLSNDPSGFGTTIITAESSVTAGTISTLNDTFSAHDNVATTSSEEILTSRDVTVTTPVGISLQNQTTITEVPMRVPGKASFITGENVTTITIHDTRASHSVTGNAAVMDTTEDMSANSSENVIDPTVSPRNSNAAASVPCDTTTAALGETVPTEGRFCSGNVNSMNIPLGEASIQPGSHSPTEAIPSTASLSVPANVIHGDTECIGESVASNIDTISTLGDISRIPETNINFENSKTPTECLQEANMPIATDDIIQYGPMASIDISQDHSSITFAPADDPTPRININDSRGRMAINAAKDSHNTSEVSVMSAGDNTTGTTVDKCIITTVKPSGDITTIAGDTISIHGDNDTGVNVPRDTVTTMVLEDNHTTTIEDTTSPENRIIFRKTSGSILEFTSTQYETSIPGHIRPNKEASTFETLSTHMANLASRETYSTDFSKDVMNIGEIADEVTNTVNDTITTCRRNSTSAFKDSIFDPESITTSGETLMSGQITTAILDNNRNPNESSAFERITCPGEAPKTAVNFMPQVNLVDRNASNATSRPSTLKEDAILNLRDAITPVTVAGEAVISHRPISSPQKSTDVSASPSSLEDSILETFTDSKQIIQPPLSTVSSVPYSGCTTKEAPTIGTKDGIAETQAAEIPTSPEETLLPCTVIASEEVNHLAFTSNSGQSFTSGVPLISEKYFTPEATTALGEITFAGVITAPEETFASKGTTSVIEAPISRSVSDTSVASLQQVIISPADISILDTTFSSRQTEAPQNPSSNNCIPPEDITAIMTNSMSSPGHSDRPDEEVTSGNVNIYIHICSETLNPRAITEPTEVPISEEVATSASGDLKTPTTYFPENTATTVAEDAAIAPGNNSTTPENPINNTILGKSNYHSTRDTSTTMQGALNVAAEKTPTARPKMTTDANMIENSACTPWHLKTAPEDSLIIAQEESTIVTSRKITDASTETPVATEETNASFSGELSAAPEGILSEETDIAMLKETTDPTTREIAIALGEMIEISLGEMTVAISLGEKPETTETTGDAMGQRNAPTHDDEASPVSENMLIDVPREVSCSVNATEATTKEIPTSVYEATTIIHRKTSMALNVTTSGASPAISPEETPDTVSAKATTIRREASAAVPRGDIPIVHFPKEMLMAVSKKITSVFQGKSNTVNPVAPPPYGFILFLGILLMVVLVVVGLCMVI